MNLTFIAPQACLHIVWNSNKRKRANRVSILLTNLTHSGRISLNNHGFLSPGVIPVVPGESDNTQQNERFGCISWLSLTVSDTLSSRDFYQKVVGWNAKPIETEDSEGHGWGADPVEASSARCLGVWDTLSSHPGVFGFAHGFEIVLPVLHN